MNSTDDSAAPSDDRGVRYERRDVRFRPLAGFAALLGGVVILVMAGIASVFQWFGRGEGYQSKVPIPASVGAERELQELRRSEEEVLGSYGWVSKEQGIVRIPIERAMQLVIERGSVSAHATVE